MRMQKWEYVTIQRAIMTNCLPLLLLHEKTQSVNANIWVRNKLFAGMRVSFPQCDSFAPSMLIKRESVCVWAYLKNEKKRTKCVCNYVLQHANVYMCVDKYMLFLCAWNVQGCGWVLVSVNIGVLLSEKLLPTQGLGLVFTEWERGGGSHTHTHTHRKGLQTLTQSRKYADTHKQTRR